MSKHEISELHQLQMLSLNEKVERTKARIRQWVEYWGIDHVYVSFSGGKDSLCLLHIARSMYPDMKAVFLDTSLEFPELREFVSTFDNVEFLKPPMNFRQVIEKYGYPVISKEVSECVMGAKIYLTKLMEERQSLRAEQSRAEQSRAEQSCLMRNSIENFAEQANMLETAHLSAIWGGNDTSIITNAIDYSELYQTSALPRTKGGYDNKYRKLCGLGIYSKNSGNERLGVRRLSSEAGTSDGDMRKSESDKGEYP